MDKITDKLIDILKEKWIVKNILDMKYEMEHKEKMKNICNNITEMTCVILNTTEESGIVEERMPEVHTQIIYHYKMETDLTNVELIEYYIFAYDEDELNQYRYVNRMTERRREIYLSKEEYLEFQLK